MPESSTSLTVSPAARKQAPSIQALVTPSRARTRDAPAQPASSSGSSDQLTGICLSPRKDSPVTPSQASPTGTVTTTMPTRTVCDSAVATGSALKRSPMTIISAMPPGTLPK